MNGMGLRLCKNITNELWSNMHFAKLRTETKEMHPVPTDKI